jgi:hypothetical protein
MYGLLKGMTVVEGAAFIAGPSCGLYMAQMGAEVIRFDQIGGGPDSKRWPLGPSGQSLYWEGLNKGKKSLAINLGSPEGRELAQRVATAGNGLFVTNFPVNGFLSYEKLSALREDLVCLRVMGWADGTPAVDYTINAAVGVPYITGHADDPRPGRGVWRPLLGHRQFPVPLVARELGLVVPFPLFERDHRQALPPQFQRRHSARSTAADDQHIGDGGAGSGRGIAHTALRSEIVEGTDAGDLAILVEDEMIDDRLGDAALSFVRGFGAHEGDGLVGANNDVALQPEIDLAGLRHAPDFLEPGPAMALGIADGILVEHTFLGEQADERIPVAFGFRPAICLDCRDHLCLVRHRLLPLHFASV